MSKSVSTAYRGWCFAHASRSILHSLRLESGRGFGNYYESNENQTNLRLVDVTLANGEALSVKVDYQFLSEPTSPGMQHFNFMRFGAYHDQDTTDYGDDNGYLADVSYWKTDTTSGATKSGDYAIRKETNFYTDFDLGPLRQHL